MGGWIGRRNRPVRRRIACWDADVQALLPLGWCVCCGMEIYRSGAERCEDCKEENYDVFTDRPQPLSGLQTGAKPG